MIYPILIEAAEELKNLNNVKTELKKKLNVCMLAKFKSEADCSDFYSVFFCNIVPESYKLSAKEWFSLYNDLMGEPTFFKNLIYFISNWKPKEYTGMFKGLQNLIKIELDEIQKDNKTIYLTEITGLFRQLYMKMDQARLLLNGKLFQPELMKFAKMCSVISEQCYREWNSKLQKEIRAREIESEDGLVKFIRTEEVITESCKELLNSLDAVNEMLIDMNTAEPIDEGIVDAAKALVVKKRKVEDYMDRKLFKFYDSWRKNKEKKNHEEMVGDTLKLSGAIKKIFATFISWNIFNPLIGIITGLVTVGVDRRTKKTDRLKIIYDLRDELQIVDEKISIADRKGDDKSKIELMRIKQRLEREYKRISRGIVFEKE